MDVRAYNRNAWNSQVEQQNRWTVPVSSDEIARARKGDWAIVLTPTIPVPKNWFPDLNGLDTLCLASGGGQQGPILAAAGARITVYDNSPRQLEQDRFVAEREGLAILTVEGDMANLEAFADESFDLIFHPCSNVFAADVRPVWREAFRVLRPGGTLLAGFTNPVRYIFDDELSEQGVFHVKHSIPYSDLVSLTSEQREAYAASGRPLEFGHTLDDQIGGQLDAGFVLVGFFEDKYAANDPLSLYVSTFMATRAVKPTVT